MSSSDISINHLLEDICSRHASKFAAELEQSLGIKLRLGSQKYEYVYDAVFDVCAAARAMQNRILEFGKQPSMFSVKKCTRRFGQLHAVFKFQPENVL